MYASPPSSPSRTKAVADTAPQSAERRRSRSNSIENEQGAGNGGAGGSGSAEVKGSPARESLGGVSMPKKFAL
jgi:hypothetical protein